MSAALLLCRSRIRESWRPVVVLVLTIALGTGVSLAAVAGARRTAAAHDRLLEVVNVFDLGISLNEYDPTALPARLLAIDGVREVSQHAGFFDVRSPDIPADVPNFWFGPVGGQKTVDRVIVYEGRLGEAVDEVALNQTLAERTGLGVGDRLRLEVVDPTSFETVEESAVEIVGIMGLPEAVIEDEADANNIVYLSPAYVDSALDRVAWGQAVLRVEDGPGVAEALAAAGYEQDQNRSSLREQAQDSVRVLAVALAGLGVLAGLATLTIAVQWLSRLIRRSPGEEIGLHAIGCRPRQRVRADVLLALTITVPGVVVGALLALVASPLFPVGSLREVAALRGASFDGWALIGGGAVLAAALVGVATVVAAVSRRRSGRGTPTPMPLGPLASLPTAATGIRLATGGSRPTIVVGLAMAVAAAIAAMTFTGSLDRLVADPARSGFTWDLMAKEPFTLLDEEAIEATIAAADGVERATGLGYLEARVAGRPVVVSTWSSVDGSPFPPVVTGRLPSGAFEALVGEQTLDDLGLAVGDRIPVEIFEFDDPFASEPSGSVTHDFTVVGTAISPAIGIGGTDVPRLDGGVLLDGSDVVDLVPSGRQSDLYLFDLADAVDPEAFREENFPDGLPDAFSMATEWYRSATPSEVIEAASARPALVAGAGAVGLAMVATMGHSLFGLVA